MKTTLCNTRTLLCAILLLLAGRLIAQVPEPPRPTNYHLSNGRPEMHYVVGTPVASNEGMPVLQVHEFSREKEFSGGTVSIVNSLRNIIVKKWSEPRVKVLLALSFDSADVWEGTDWFKLYGVFIDSTYPKELEIFSWGTSMSRRWLKGDTTDHTNYTTDEMIRGATPAQLEALKSVSSRVGTITIYVPELTRLNIYNAFSDVTVEGDFALSEGVIRGTQLVMGDLDSLKLTAAQSNVAVGNARSIFLSIKNSSFFGQAISRMVSTSSASTIGYRRGDSLRIRISDNDKYQIDSLGSADIHKSFGLLNIDRLERYMKFRGKNADCRIGQLGHLVKKIDIDDSYADLRISTKGFTDFTVKFLGVFSPCFAPFDKYGLSPIGAMENSRRLVMLNFTSAVGNVKSNPANLDIKCSSCTVNFY